MKIKVRNRRRCRESTHASPNCLSCLLLIALDAKTTDAIIKFSSTLRQIEGKQDQIRGVRIFLDSVYILKIFDQSLIGTRVFSFEKNMKSQNNSCMVSVSVSTRWGSVYLNGSFVSQFVYLVSHTQPTTQIAYGH